MPPSRIIFVQVESWEDLPSSKVSAYVGLKWDPWDDFGFKTSFEVQLKLPGKKPIELGVVKILKNDQKSGRTELSQRFTKLPKTYCSLGQSLAYYEILHGLGTWSRRYLQALCDVVLSPIIKQTFELHNGFSNSLLRSSGAEIALADAPNLFLTDRPRTLPVDISRLDFQLLTSVGGDTFDFHIGLEGNDLQERCAVIIGYNATGKTKLLGNIGMLASRKENDPDELRIRTQFGQFVGDPPKLSGVLAISYSAFDTFEIPQPSSEQQSGLGSRTVEEAQGQRGYVYCGLRKPGNDSLELKGTEELTWEFNTALERCKSRGLRDRFLRCMGILLEEPSFREYSAISALMQKNGASCAKFYLSLSTGHKMVLKVATQLVAFLQTSSLVLFDEPETHLHPSLMAALMKCLRLLLDETSSFAILATHSPVVIQETPSKNVHVLRRNGRETIVEGTSIETYGENIGILTSEIFDLNASQSDYRHVLQELASRRLDEIDELFAKPLGTQARSFIRSVQTPKR